MQYATVGTVVRNQPMPHSLGVQWETGTVCIQVYTMRQKKGTSFLLCAFFNTSEKLMNFFTYIEKSICYKYVYLILMCIKNFM